MQGRLSPKYKGRYQAFPVGICKQEFLIAKAVGLKVGSRSIDAISNVVDGKFG